jgi:hypothetical protein
MLQFSRFSSVGVSAGTNTPGGRPIGVTSTPGATMRDNGGTAGGGEGSGIAVGGATTGGTAGATGAGAAERAITVGAGGVRTTIGS